MFVRNWMSAPVVVIPPVVPAPAALSFMEKRKIRRLPVVEEGKLLGIVTKSDLQAALGKDTRAARDVDLAVSDVMTARPVTVPPDETLEGAAQLMLRKKISGLPVVEEGAVVGIITESDIFRAFDDIMGISEAGARLVMTVGEDEDLLATIEKRLNGLALRSLVTYHNSEQGRWEIVMRVRGRVPAKRR